MRIGATAASAATTGRRPGAGAGGGAPGRSLVPLEPSRAVNRSARLHGRLPYQYCAFLAHLSLQYDGMAARRRARREMLDAAIAGYGEGGRKARPDRNTLDLRT